MLQISGQMDPIPFGEIFPLSLQLGERPGAGEVRTPDFLKLGGRPGAGEVRTLDPLKLGERLGAGEVRTPDPLNQGKNPFPLGQLSHSRFL